MQEQILSGYVTEIKAGDFLERITTNKKPSGGCSIEWLYDVFYEVDEITGEQVERYGRTGEYIVTKTGELKKQKEQAQKRIDNFRQIRVACNNFKWKLRANAHNAKLFITLTYAENMTETKRLYDDFRKFWQRWKRIKGNENCGYMLACEPQERGAWHIHLITIGGVAYQKSEDVAKMWQHGFVKVLSCKNIADLGGYLTNYLVNLTPNAEDSEEKKASKKNARLPFYPARFRFLRWSKGLEKAEITHLPKENANAEKEDLDNYEKIKDVTKKTIVPEILTPIYTRYILYVHKRTIKKMGKQKAKSKRKLYKKNNKNP